MARGEERVALEDRTLDLIQATLLGEAADHIPIGVLVADAGGRYLAANLFAARLLGYEREELPDLPVAATEPSPRSDSLYSDLVRGERSSGAPRTHAKDGSELEVRFTAAALGDAAEGVRVGIVEERETAPLPPAHQAEPAETAFANDQRILLGEALDRVPLAVFVADEEMRYLAVSRHACDLLGYEREELLALGLGDVSPFPISRELYRDMMVRGRLSGRAELVRRTGDRFEIEFAAAATRIGHLPVYMSFTQAVDAPKPVAA